MDKVDVVKVFRDHGLLLRPSAVDLLAEKSDDELTGIAQRLAAREKKIISDIDIAEAVSEIKVPTVEIHRAADFCPAAREWSHRYKVDSAKDITGRSRCKGEIGNFVNYIKDRYAKLRGVFAARPSMLPVIPLEKLSSARGAVRIVGIVYQKTTTKKGHIALQLEDESASVTAIALKGSAAAARAAQVVEDEVIALDVRPSGNIAIINDVVWPDLPPKPKAFADCDLAVAFLSDIHVGSKFFCERQFERMLRWLNGSGEGKGIAEKIGYAIIAGDCVDGIGVYPKQERQLIAKDIYEQYKIFERLLEQIPDHIQVFVVPGNHDAVRRAEPQPAIPKDILNANPNVHLLGNPARIEIEGINFLVYHGASLDAIIPSIPGLSYAKPESACIELLKRRHLSPIYDKGESAPEPEDLLFIEDSINVLHTGHVHKNCHAEYRGVVVVNSGTWQALTEYQIKLGHVPSPCLLPVYNLGSGRITHIDFTEEIIIYE